MPTFFTSDADPVPTSIISNVTIKKEMHLTAWADMAFTIMINLIEQARVDSTNESSGLVANYWGYAVPCYYGSECKKIFVNSTTNWSLF